MFKGILKGYRPRPRAGKGSGIGAGLAEIRKNSTPPGFLALPGLSFYPGGAFLSFLHAPIFNPGLICLPWRPERRAGRISFITLEIIRP